MTAIVPTTGWESVTDVPCPGCRVGIVRWAEAGYVPGWRECDTCGRQYMGDPESGRLTQRGKPTRRVTAKRIADVAAAREAVEQAAQQRGDKLAAGSAVSDLRGSYHGDEWHAIGGYYGPDASTGGATPESSAAYMAAWRAGATPEAVAALDGPLGGRLALPGEGAGSYGIRFSPVVSAISRDGLRVVVYRQGSGGTYTQTVADAVAGKVVHAPC